MGQRIAGHARPALRRARAGRAAGGKQRQLGRRLLGCGHFGHERLRIVTRLAGESAFDLLNPPPFRIEHDLVKVHLSGREGHGALHENCRGMDEK
jgi:hypothetical protein